MEPLIIFDGMCNLCTFSVRFILTHETAPLLQFAPLQSKAGMRLLKTYGFDPTDAKTFVLIQNGQAYTRSEAALRVAKYLRWPWRELTIFRAIPKPLRDTLYDYVALNRYRWFGQKEICMLPTPELRARFMED
ncbi:MAG TPA: thiol-disulfide oxidoreductase DCC family protein [Thiolinea sp.]|nr:thiol-disulfide oxidoreductase DCC family protein [Thiolinea sp.]